MQRVKREPRRRTHENAHESRRQPDRVKLPYPADRAADRAQLDDEGKPFFYGCINGIIRKLVYLVIPTAPNWYIPHRLPV